MAFGCLSNKKSPAPFLYCVLQAGLLCGLVITTPDMINFQMNWKFILFWLDVVITLIFYFITHLRDPGYVPFDVPFFTEQEDTYRENKGKLSARHESHLQLRGESKFDIEVDQNSSPKSSNMIEMNNRVSKSGFFMFKADISFKNMLKPFKMSEISTHPNTGKMSTASGTNNWMNDKDCPSKSETKTENNNQFENDNYQPESLDPDLRRDVEIPIGSPLENEAHCENTLADESIDITNRFNNINNSREEREDRDGEPEGAEEEHKDRQGSIEIKIKSPPRIPIQNARHEEYNDSKVPFHGYESENNVMPNTLNTSCNIRAQTGDDDHSKIVRMEDLLNRQERYHPLNEEEGMTARNEGITRVPIEKLAALNSGYIKKKQLETTTLEIPSEEHNTTTNNEKPNILSTRIPLNLINISSISMRGDETKKNSEEKEGDILYVERRYCTVCNIEQPIRSKHCKDCNRCIAQYDHHCPWVGTCVGERNHLQFFWFLLFQMIEAAWAEISVVTNLASSHIVRDGIDSFVLNATLCTIIGFFTLFVGSLLFYHAFLAACNLTTWEHLSWNKISYLNEWSKKWGSPFSKGVLVNLRNFCGKWNKELQRWRLPKYKKTSLNQVKSQ